MKKLLILAGAEVHCKVVKAAKEMGIYVAVTDYLKNSPAKVMADENLEYDIFDIEGLVQYAKENNIDGVLGFCIDPAQKPAQQIAQRLGLPAFGTEEQVLALTNKVVFKKLCLDNGVDVIPEYSEEDIKSNNIEYPVLAKPVDCRGSRGIAVCRSREELLQALPIAKSSSSNGCAVIEKYMSENQDLTITYIVKCGIPTLISIGDRFSGREEDNLNRQNVLVIQPSRYTQMYMKYVNDRVIRMIQNLGIQNGPVFMQGFVDGNTVRMYDPGIRFPGNEYEVIYEKATGLSPMKSIIPYILGGEIDDFGGKLNGSYDLNGKCAIQYMVNAGSGTITEFSGLDEITKLPNIVEVQQKRFVGEVIEQTGDVRHRIAEISILVKRDIEEMKAVIRNIQSKLKVFDENGKNMLISPFDISLIDSLYKESYC